MAAICFGLNVLKILCLSIKWYFWQKIKRRCWYWSPTEGGGSITLGVQRYVLYTRFIAFYCVPIACDSTVVARVNPRVPEQPYDGIKGRDVTQKSFGTCCGTRILLSLCGTRTNNRRNMAYQVRYCTCQINNKGVKIYPSDAKSISCQDIFIFISQKMTNPQYTSDAKTHQFPRYLYFHFTKMRNTHNIQQLLTQNSGRVDMYQYRQRQQHRQAQGLHHRP